MYSLVLMMALGGGAETPAFHGRDNGCCGCYGNHGGDCYGGGRRHGRHGGCNGGGCWGGNGGCYGGGYGCNGGGCAGRHQRHNNGCCGAVVYTCSGCQGGHGYPPPPPPPPP